MNLLKRLIAGTHGSSLHSQLWRSGIGTFTIRIANVILELALVVVLARKLGAHSYGIYAYAYALMRTLAIPAQAGLPTLAVREVAAYVAREEWGMLRGLLLRINQITIVFTAFIVCVAVAAAVSWQSGWGADSVKTFVLAMLLMPFMALGNIRGATLRGLHFIVQGQLPENILRPAFFLALLSASWFCWGGRIGAPMAMGMHAGAAAMAFLIGAVLLFRHLPSQLRDASPCYETRRWLLSAVPLSMIMGMMVINNQAAILILGIFRPASTVGVYGVVSQAALVIALPLTAVNLTVGPHVAKMYAQGDREGMQLVALWSGRLILASAVATGLAVILGGKILLAVAFGAEFVRGYGALTILAIGQMATACTGASMILLNMAKQEVQVAKAFAMAVVLNVAANFTLVPVLGLVGAAVGVSISLFVLNVVLARQVQKQLAINPLPLAFPWMSRKHESGVAR
jgi:O-antigen/teichoic acid export membrane protein